MTTPTRLSGLSRLLQSAASTVGIAANTTPDAPAAAEPAAPAPAAETGNEVEVVTFADAQTAMAKANATGRAAGFAEANTRMAAVFASDAGKANPTAAAFMLEHTTAPAADIIAKLPSMGGGAATPPAPAAEQQATPPANASALATLENAPAPTVVDGGKAANDGGTGTTTDTDAMWASVGKGIADGSTGAGALRLKNGG